jgi:hypothetical protein
MMSTTIRLEIVMPEAGVSLAFRGARSMPAMRIDDKVDVGGCAFTCTFVEGVVTRLGYEQRIALTLRSAPLAADDELLVRIKELRFHG